MISFEEFLVESKSRIIQALVQKFGREQVFSKELNYELNASDFQKIFDTLNTTLFAGKLGSIPLHYWTTSQIAKEFKIHSVTRKIPAKFYGCFLMQHILYVLVMVKTSIQFLDIFQMEQKHVSSASRGLLSIVLK